MTTPRIAVAGVRKTYGSTVALDGVGFAAAPGTVHGILGENGAGKSTLMKILYGLERPDAGTLSLDGRPLVGSTRHGLGMVHQHFALVPDLSVLDNVILGAGRGLGVVDRRAWAGSLRELADRLHWPVDPDLRVSALGVGQRQRVEILKALLVRDGTATQPRVLILDEPTAVLTPQEVDELIPAVQAVAAAGTTVLFISHKLHEVERLCPTVTILRRGRVVYDGPRPERAAMARHLVGEVESVTGTYATLPAGAPRLEVQHLTGDGLHDVTFTVGAGEIVGIAGVDGNGQGALVRAVLRNPTAVTTPGIPAAERLGGINRVGLIPDDRHQEGLVMALSIEANVVLKDHARPPFATWGWLHPAQWLAHARELIARFAIRGGGPELPVQGLSGGNQQKVVIARELHRRPGLIVAVNPTRGLDLAASADVLRALVAAREGQAGVLLVHHDLDELLAVSDRILVMEGGRLHVAPGRDRAAIARLMLGGAHAGATP